MPEIGARALLNPDGVLRATRESTEITRESSMLDLAYCQMGRQLLALEAQRPHAWEGKGPEGVHQMRVATRRLRAALRTFRTILPGESVKSLEYELRWLAALLGEVRDADVIFASCAACASTLSRTDAGSLTGFEQHLGTVRDDARARLLSGLGGNRYLRLMTRLEQFTATGPTREMPRRSGALSVGEGAGLYIRSGAARVIKRGRHIRADAPDEQLHELRIRAKRFRYLMEFFNDVYPDELRDPLKASKMLQNVLGSYHDDVVMCAYVRAYEDRHRTATSREELAAIGHLLERSARHGAEARRRFPEAWQAFEQTVRSIDIH